MSATITPEKAKAVSDEILTQWANEYRVESGAYKVIANEIARRHEIRKTRILVLRAAAIAGVSGVIGLLFYLLRG